MKLFRISDDGKTVVWNMVGAFVIRGLGLILSLFTLPAHIRFFNDNVVLGVWFTVLSILNWILNFDLGIGNGLRNHLTESIAKGEHHKSKKYVSSAYAAIGGLALIAAIVFVVLGRFINWNEVFNIQQTNVSAEALFMTVVIVFFGILLQLVLKIITAVFYALQKAAVNNFLGLITSVITVAALYILPSSNNQNNLLVMATVHLVAVNAPLLIATVIVFCKKKYRFMAPSLKSVKKAEAKKVLGLGGVFFFVQIVYMVIMSTNEYMITYFFGSEPVVEYQVYYRLFTLAGTLFALAMAPVWSSVTKALAEGNYSWIVKLLKKIVLLSAVCIIGEFLLIPLAQFIINIWLGEEAILVQTEAGIAFALLGASMIINSVLSTFANGIGELKTQAVLFSVGAIIKIPLAWFLIRIFNSWVMVVMANVLVLLPYCIIQPFWLKKFLWKKIQESRRRKNEPFCK